MKPKLHPSLKVAHAVLHKIKVDKSHVLSDVVGYENGREHGLCLQIIGNRQIGKTTVDKLTTVCWSECRNSDQIVIYVGLPDERFEIPGNRPTERAYKEAKYFSSNDVQKAADVIGQIIFSASKTTHV